MYTKIGDAAKELGVSIQIIRRWIDRGELPFIKTPGRHRLVDITNFGEKSEEPKDGVSIFYCRVSSKKQEDDLERQVSLAKEKYPEHNIIKDIGSGINWKRKGLRSILERVMRGEVKEVVVFHKDRLCRFGFELLEFIFSKNNTRIVVSEEKDHKSAEEELAKDVMDIIHVFSCRQMGKRKYQNKRIHEDKNISIEESESDSNEHDGRRQDGVQCDCKESSGSDQEG